MEVEDGAARLWHYCQSLQTQTSKDGDSQVGAVEHVEKPVAATIPGDDP